MNEEDTRRVLAAYDEQGVYVYQAFETETVRYAAEHGTFGKGFGLDRMTWIKPSFGWMLHRSGYATKHRQEAVARIHLTHEGFESILAQAVLSYHNAEVHGSVTAWQDALRTSRVRCQWDPDRDLAGRPLNHRAIQLGIRGLTVRRYVGEWILGVEDVTSLAHAVHQAVQMGTSLPTVPEEREYPVSPDVRRSLGYTQ